MRFLSSESHILNTKTKSFLHAPLVDEKIRQLVRKKEIVNRIERCPSKWKDKSYPYDVAYICARALTLDESGFESAADPAETCDGCTALFYRAKG